MGGGKVSSPGCPRGACVMPCAISAPPPFLRSGLPPPVGLRSGR